MNRTIARALIPLILTGFVTTFSCSDTEHRIPLGSSRVIINMGLPPETPDAELGLIERIRRLFVPDAIAQSAPAAFSSILVRVTGADIGTIVQEFGAYEVISMNVPAGALRLFEVTAIVAPGDPSAAASFRARRRRTARPGQTVNVPVVMGLNETKIVVPDYGSSSIVMINSMSGSGFVRKVASDIFGSGLLRPYDVDVDNHGRIFFANSPGGAPYAGIFRMNSINGTVIDSTCIQIISGSTDVVSLAIDQKRNLLYYVTATPALYKTDLNGFSPQLLTTTGFTTISAVAADENSGYIYVAYSVVGTVPIPRICRYNPAGSGSILNVYNSGSVASDLVVKGDHVYASFVPTPSIIQLPLDLVPAGPPPMLTGKPGGSDPFLGLYRFLAVSNRKFYIIDERSSDGTNANERIVSFGDINGTGWETYPPSPQSIFVFYSAC